MNSQTQAQAGNADDLQTEGRILRQAWFYDFFAKVMSLGQDGTLRQETVERAGVQPGHQVLDVGCGTGALTLVAARQAGATGQVYGVDASPEMIQVATSHTQRNSRGAGAAQAWAAVTFRTGLIERLAFPDQSFDVVLSSLMMHHLPGDLRRRGLLEVRRVLKPGGRVFIVDFNGGSGAGLHRIVGWRGHGAQPADAQEAAAPDLTGLLTECGFVDVTHGPMRMRGVDFTTGLAERVVHD
jgi:demethylmenaquinone methyltransferase/2-methoxy-6-polyprenyl-1,4-benzoquinol methylase/phosphoethanolamine N-methyltransferase